MAEIQTNFRAVDMIGAAKPAVKPVVKKVEPKVAVAAKPAKVKPASEPVVKAEEVVAEEAVVDVKDGE